MASGTLAIMRMLRWGWGSAERRWQLRRALYSGRRRVEELCGCTGSYAIGRYVLRGRRVRDGADTVGVGWEVYKW